MAGDVNYSGYDTTKVNNLIAHINEYTNYETGVNSATGTGIIYAAMDIDKMKDAVADVWTGQAKEQFDNLLKADAETFAQAVSAAGAKAISKIELAVSTMERDEKTAVNSLDEIGL